MIQPVESRRIAGLRVDATSYEDATARILEWARNGESRMVAVANTHGAVEAGDKEEMRQAMDAADLITPDGMPLVWGLKRLGVASATRVYGPDLMLHVCKAAAEQGIPIGLYGGTDDRLPRLIARLEEVYPGINIVYTWAPPFRPLTTEEDAEAVREITASGAQILFVGLGCPKQELWMEAHRGHLPAVMLGVGAAFDFHAGEVRQAPPVLQRMGFEWAFRLAMEPRRLWRRYSYSIPRFVWRFGKQLAFDRNR